VVIAEIVRRGGRSFGKSTGNLISKCMSEAVGCREVPTSCGVWMV